MTANVKCCVVGDGAVGKTVQHIFCLLVCYTKNEFPDDYQPTIFDNYATMVMCDGKVVNFQLWDTAGQEDYDRMRPLSYPGTQVFLLCFSLISKTSLQNVVEKWMPELRVHGPDIPIILVGCKSDLRDITNAAVIKELKLIPSEFVSTAEGQKVAQSLHLEYAECSAREMLNVNGVMDIALRAALFPKKKEGVSNGNCNCNIL